MTQTEKSRDNPFEVLGVPLDVDGRAVRQAFARKLREARTSGDQDVVRKVQSAFEAIRDDMPRKQARQWLENEARLAPLLQEADAALERGELEGARRLLVQVTEISPDFISALWKLSKVEEALENVNGTINVLEKLVRLEPQNPAASFDLARAYANKGAGVGAGDPVSKLRFLEKALEAVDRARELGVDEVNCLMLRYSILRQLDRKEEAREGLSRFIGTLSQIDYKQVSVVAFLLHCHAEDGKEEEFQSTLDRIRTLMPDDPERRIFVCGALNDISRSLLRFAPPMAVRCAELAEACLPDPEATDAADPGEALRRSLRRLIEVESRAAPIFRQVEEALAKSEFQQARGLLERVLKIIPDSAHALQALSDVEDALGNAEGAIQALEQVLELMPENPAVLSRLAEILAKRGSPDGPGVPSEKRKSLEKALEVLDRARSLGAEESSCVLLGSYIRAWLGRREETRAVLNEFLDRMTGLGEREVAVVNRLLHCQAVEGLDGDFQKTLERVKAQFPDDPERRQWLGGELLKIGQGLSTFASRLAIRCGELARECRPSDATIPGILNEWRARPRDMRTPAKPERRPWSFWQKTVMFLVVMFLLRACSMSPGRREYGTSRTSRPDAPLRVWSPGLNRDLPVRFPAAGQPAPGFPDPTAGPSRPKSQPGDSSPRPGGSAGGTAPVTGTGFGGGFDGTGRGGRKGPGGFGPNK